MQTLKEYLQSWAEEDERTRDERFRIAHEWIGAVERLVDQVRHWIEQSDDKKIVEFDYEATKIREERLIPYVARVLVIRLNATEIRLVPIFRYNVGPYLKDGEIRVNRSYGRMDLTGGGKKYLLYRHEIDPADVWYIVDEDRFVPRKLDRETFEQALLDLLQ